MSLDRQSYNRSYSLEVISNNQARVSLGVVCVLFILTHYIVPHRETPGFLKHSSDANRGFPFQKQFS